MNIKKVYRIFGFILIILFIFCICVSGSDSTTEYQKNIFTFGVLSGLIGTILFILGLKKYRTV